MLLLFLGWHSEHFLPAFPPVLTFRLHEHTWFWTKSKSLQGHQATCLYPQPAALTSPSYSPQSVQQQPQLDPCRCSKHMEASVQLKAGILPLFWGWLILTTSQLLFSSPVHSFYCNISGVFLAFYLLLNLFQHFPNTEPLHWLFFLPGHWKLFQEKSCHPNLSNSLYSVLTSAYHLANFKINYAVHFYLTYFIRSYVGETYIFIISGYFFQFLQ